MIGAVVLLAAGRPLLFEVLQRGTTYKFPEVRWIVTKDLARWLDDPARSQPVVLDARTEAEFDVSHLRGALRVDPYRPSLDPLAGFAKDTSIVVYSSAGYRGARVASWLGQQGYRNVQNLGSSLFQWTNEGRPIFRGSRPAEVVHPYDGWWGWGWLLEGEYRAKVPAVGRHSVAP
ncbi:MAG: rhodanese-like domain-containing protein [Gemmatimonadota bacterium]|nr:rhodanese-like domain-containing protein [Gemmatimonadota bacterium]